MFARIAAAENWQSRFRYFQHRSSGVSHPIAERDNQKNALAAAITPALIRMGKYS
jgi:hypothetical protein